MNFECKIIDEIRMSQDISGKINIKKDEKFNLLVNEFQSDSKIEVKFAG